MSDLEDRVRRTAAHVKPKWDDARSMRVGRAVVRTQQRRARNRRMIVTAAAACVLLFGALASTGRLASAATALRQLLAFLRNAPAETSAPPATAPLASHEKRGPKAVGEPAVEPAIEPAPTAIVEAPSVAPTATPPPPKAPSRIEPAREKPADWRSLAREQHFEAAYDAMKGVPSDVKDEAQDLLLASDVARLSSHPDEALAPLERILRDHRKDSRAPLAAFTLGRVLLNDLKRPADAANAFADARALNPDGGFAEDALAREVEAAARAGDLARARARGQEYLSKYPTGLRVDSVKRWAGLP